LDPSVEDRAEPLGQGAQLVGAALGFDPRREPIQHGEAPQDAGHLLALNIADQPPA
jgi:hypothetical protein